MLSRRQEFSFSRASTIIASVKFIVRSCLPACGLSFACWVCLLLGLPKSEEADAVPKDSDAFDKVYGPAPLAQQQDSLQDVQQLGWGVTLRIDLPQDPGRKATVLKAPDSELIVFKEAKWMGLWSGYYFTTIEHGGAHLTGYKLDQATEPCEKFEGPKANKYFGVVNGVLGYHFDNRGPPPSSDPVSDKKLLEMGWGTGTGPKPEAPETPPPAPETFQAAPETSQAAPETPQPAPATPQTDPANSVGVKQEPLTAQNLALLTQEKCQNFGNMNPPSGAEEKATMSRRACYNLLDRIRKNPNRLKLLKLLAHETENLDMDLSKLKPFTEVQLKTRYGDEEAKEVMKFKEQQGLTKDDPNCPGKKVYLTRLGVCFSMVITVYRSSSVEHGRV